MNGFWSTYTHDLAHRHVLIGYAFAWLIQIGYLLLVLRRSVGNGKTPPDSKRIR